MAVRENDTIHCDITQNIAIRYDMMHKFNALQHGLQRDIVTGDNGDAAVVDRQVVSCMWSRTIDNVV